MRSEVETEVPFGYLMSPHRPPQQNAHTRRYEARFDWLGKYLFL